MVDFEVERLRRLRGAALRLRAVARALGNGRWARDEVLLSRGRCAAWRVARTVTGRLRAHPHGRYQKDAGIGTLVRNSFVAASTSWAASSRPQAIAAYAAELKSVMRELNDARALTWAADLSDTFGRSQREIRGLIDAVERETRECGLDDRIAARHAPGVNGDSRFLTI